MRPGLISTQELADRLDSVRVLDASWYLPTSGRDPRAEWLERRIPRARFFDLDAASDPDSSLPHMLPDAARFEATVRALGISTGDPIVVYDGSGANISAARCWWMFRAFGHDEIRVLDGGLPLWLRQGRQTDEGEPLPAMPGDFRARPRAGLVLSLEQVRALAADGGTQLVDMRSAARFAGEEPEPRAGIRGGHIPGSRNVPYQTLVDADGRLLAAEALRARLA
ncbi:MAG TPA: sulfurtransferase, partial [Gemmatimonadales bacterium]|nr:sulfurtransferase [Gemmatimonadales bacterium]